MKAGKEEKKQLAMATKWNQEHKPGTDVIVTKDFGEPSVTTKTRSNAFMLGANGDYLGHTAVILLDGVSGAYSLDRVKPAQEVNK